MYVMMSWLELFIPSNRETADIPNTRPITALTRHN